MYFGFFALYALLITPIALQFQIRVDEHIRWRIRVLAAGLPVWQKDGPSAKEGPSKGRKLSLAEGKEVLRCFHWQRVEVQALLSFEDAALTAMTYALSRTILETFQRCGALPSALKGRVRADFQAQGSKVQVLGIGSARLGTLAIAYLRLRAARTRKGRRELYAASH